MKETDFIINIGSCMDNTVEASRSCDVSDELAQAENSVSPSRIGKNVGEDSVERISKERRMSLSAKKYPKPPRPPRGLSLDAADQRLIQEISEILEIKRARIERMKALRKAKAAKATSASTSSGGSVVAMFFTVIFCLVFLFHGCHPSGIWPRKSSAIGIRTLANSNVATVDNIGVAQDTGSVHMLSEAGSPTQAELAPEVGKATN